MFLKKTIAIAVFVGVSSLPLLASATGIVIRTNCIHSVRGLELCELGFPDPNNTDVWDITWQDTVQTRIRTSEGSFGIERWNPQTNQWADSASVGLCFERKCLYGPSTLWNSVDQQIANMEIECLVPTGGEGTCQAEYVPETDGLRVYWPDNSIEHYRISGDPFLKWSHSENGWVNVVEFGLCFDRSCILFESDALNQWSENAD